MLASPTRVTLINPPSGRGTLANREGAAGLGVVYSAAETFLYPPHTIACVAASLRSAGYQVRAMDLVVQPPDPSCLEVEAIGIFVSWATMKSDLEFLAALRSQTPARLIAFGNSMRFIGADILAHAPVDAVLVGEAEGCFGEAVERVLLQSCGSGPQLLNGTAMQTRRCDQDGWVIDLDALPFPAWDLLPTQQYKLLTVSASRGCPDRCAYCPYAAAQGHSWRTRSAENVLTELKWLVEHFNPARVIFRDPVFAYQRSRVVELCEHILRSRLRIQWECESRPEHFDAELLQLMYGAGCRWVKIGLETTDPGLLLELQRVDSAGEGAGYVARVSQVISACNKLGMNCRLFVMTGLPGQTSAMAEQTARFVTAHRPTFLNVKHFEPYPGTGAGQAEADDVEAQSTILMQAQTSLLTRSSRPGTIRQVKSWLRRVWRRPAR
jgi:radical SAM superfamily enzyme YgiQ (UPF0313 family)